MNDEPLCRISATKPYLLSLKEILDAAAAASNTMNPTLCRVFLYSSPMLPRPAIRYFKTEFIYGGAGVIRQEQPQLREPQLLRLQRLPLS